MTTYYETLGVSRDATSDEINRAFKRWARTNHPDVGGSEELFKEMSVARELLLDPGKRAIYDGALSPQEAPEEAARSASPKQPESEIPGLAELQEIFSRIEAIPVPQEVPSKKDWNLYQEVYALREKLGDKSYAILRYADTIFEQKMAAARLASEQRQYALRQQIYRAQKENPQAVQALEQRLIEVISEEKQRLQKIQQEHHEQFRPIRERLDRAGMRLRELMKIAEGSESVREQKETSETRSKPSFWERIRGKRSY